MAENRELSCLESIALLFALVPLLSVFSYPKLFNRRLMIDTATDFPQTLDGDRHEQGNSTAIRVASGNTLIWLCAIRDRAAFLSVLSNSTF